jgi:pilus assembly protein CpaF
LPEGARRSRIEQHINRMLEEESQLITFDERMALINTILDETMGYGPLQPLMDDESITEIMVNKPDEVYVEIQGRQAMELRRDVRFNSEQHILEVIDRIVAPLGRRVDESSPMVDARLPDGSRVNAVIRPLALDGPTLTIRKFRKMPFTMEDLIKNGTLSPQMALFLRAAVESKLNILVSGGTGSGKTTTLNVLARFIPGSERIITIEDSAELRFHEEHPHVVRMEARPPNIEGTGAVTIRDLVRNALRMRPNRIVVGEVRGPEALDMLQAMNTGHEGSLTTLHANSTQGRLCAIGDDGHARCDQSAASGHPQPGHWRVGPGGAAGSYDRQ